MKGFRVPYYIYLLLLVLQVRLPVPCAKVWLRGIKRDFDSHNVELWLNSKKEKRNKNKYWTVNHSLCTIEIGFIITWINLSSRDWSIRKNLRTTSSLKSTEKKSVRGSLYETRIINWLIAVQSRRTGRPTGIITVINLNIG